MVQAEDLVLAPLSVQQLAHLQAGQCQYRSQSDVLNRQSRSPHANNYGLFMPAGNDGETCRLQTGFNLYTTSSATISPGPYLQLLLLQLVLPSTCREQTTVLHSELWDPALCSKLLQALLPQDRRRHLPSVRSSPWRLCCSADLSHSTHADIRSLTLRRWVRPCNVRSQKLLVGLEGRKI